ncbi:MAG: class I tRNA ligase family protein, partial [candidate division WOR-3 bacterium]
FAGLDLKSGDLAVMDTLRREKNLLKQDTIEHSYPFCWRCRNPLIFRTTLQWYMKIDHNDDRQRKLTALEKVRWFPERSLDRMRAFVTAQPDWCLSRQRFWGVGIPVFYCKKCGEAILSAPVIRKVAQLVNESSAEVWYDDEKMGMVFKNLTCPECGASDLIREKDILDVWFDSSCSNLVVLESRADHNWPADLYLEGSDQHRGWFSLSLTVAMARRGEPPFKAVITHGFVLDKDGMAMHKSLGNAISPQDIVDRYGADVLRLWVASSEYFDDVRCGDEILERVVEAYRKIRNTIRFLLINTADFNYQSDRVGDQEIKFIDRYIRSRLQKVIEEALKGYNDYEFHRVFHLLYQFCVVELSAVYFDILKDRLYTWPKRSIGRRAAQTVLYEILESLVLLLAPILSFTAEEAYQAMSGDKAESVFLNQMPRPSAGLRDEDLEMEFEQLFRVRALVMRRLEIDRQAKNIGSSLEAKVLMAIEDERTRSLVDKYLENLPAFFIVSGIDLVEKEKLSAGSLYDNDIKLGVDIKRAEGSKCRRCWIYSTEVGENDTYPDLCTKCVNALEER